MKSRVHWLSSIPAQDQFDHHHDIMLFEDTLDNSEDSMEQLISRTQEDIFDINLMEEVLLPSHIYGVKYQD